jgi:hypothetical protein
LRRPKSDVPKKAEKARSNRFERAFSLKLLADLLLLRFGAGLFLSGRLGLRHRLRFRSFSLGHAALLGFVVESKALSTEYDLRFL